MGLPSLAYWDALLEELAFSAALARLHCLGELDDDIPVAAASPAGGADDVPDPDRRHAPDRGLGGALHQHLPLDGVQTRRIGHPGPNGAGKEQGGGRCRPRG